MLSDYRIVFGVLRVAIEVYRVVAIGVHVIPKFRLNYMQQDQIHREFKICERKSNKIELKILSWNASVGRTIPMKARCGPNGLQDKVYIDAMNVPL